jgi:Family of unknown function (DUF5647)
MIDEHDFTQKRLELTAEFGKFVFDHPEVDECLPNGAYIYFAIPDEPEFSQYSRELAERQQREEGAPIVCVRTKGLAPPQGSRLLDPVIEPVSAVA